MPFPAELRRDDSRGSRFCGILGRLWNLRRSFTPVKVSELPFEPEVDVISSNLTYREFAGGETVA